MSNRGWDKQVYKAQMRTAFVCPLCEKPTPWEDREGKVPSPETRRHPDCPEHIKEWDNKYQSQWQCSHCGAWHNKWEGIWGRSGELLQ